MHLLGKIRLFPGFTENGALFPRGWRANWLA
jgi:hypothetical protein